MGLCSDLYISESVWIFRKKFKDGCACSCEPCLNTTLLFTALTVRSSANLRVESLLISNVNKQLTPRHQLVAIVIKSVACTVTLHLIKWISLQWEPLAELFQIQIIQKCIFHGQTETFWYLIFIKYSLDCTKTICIRSIPILQLKNGQDQAVFIHLPLSHVTASRV